MATIHLQLTADLIITDSTGIRHPVVPSKHGLLLLRLALERRRLLSRDEVSAFLWPAADQATGRSRLRVALSELRKVSGLNDCLITTRQEVGLDWEAVETDVERVKSCAHSFQLDPSAYRKCIEACVSINGDLGSQYTHPWLELERAQFRTFLVGRLVEGSAQAVLCEDFTIAEQALQRALALDRFRESTLLEFARLLAGQNRLSDLVAFHEATRLALSSEHGLDTSAELQAFVAASVKPIPRPVVAATPVIAPADLVGRELEFEQLSSLFASNRIVSILGPGGVGKTSLASSWLRQQETQALKIQLEGMPRDANVCEAVIAHLGFDTQSELEQHLASPATCLFLDTCEHVVNSTAEFVCSLADSCPDLLILVTSRESLRLGRGAELLLKPLGLPAVGSGREALLSSPAAQLFLRRLIECDSEFELLDEDVSAVGAIVRRVDGLPLALELAARGCKTMTPQQVATRLATSFEILARGDTNADERQKTLRNTIEWSYNLLGQHEKEVLCRLSCLSFAWTLEDAEAVCPSRLDPMLSVAQLFDKSLLNRTRADDRFTFSMFESVRELVTAKARVSEFWSDAETRARVYQESKGIGVGRPFREHYSEFVALRGNSAENHAWNAASR